MINNNTLDGFFLYRIFCLLFALVFAFILCYLPIEQLVDRNNYLVYSSFSSEILSSRFNNGLISFLFNEPFWLFVNLFLSSVFSAENTVRIIIFFSTFITFYLVLANFEPKFLLLLLLFLFLPQVLKNNVIHLRQGLAIALFLVGWFSNNSKSKLFFLCLAALVHTSFIIVGFGMFLVDFLSRIRVSNGIKNLIYVVVGILIAIFGLVIASTFGARQAERYAEVSANISGFGFVFWSGVFFLYLSQGKDFVTRNSYSLFFILLYLATYFTLPVTGRVLESVLLIILLSSLELKKWKKLLFITVYTLYFFLNWLPRLGQPWFGWGISNY
ncbi:EpsG family protein [Pseudoalteromonas sp. ACER1]|uniref:EpsG family protein n=1 Tax=unclassified Pseudoalteromonas TaxID=194690 RepID=UPI001F17C9F7|nr:MULTISPECIES: EpsG family protein [unclassified Pseudoalteromonas]MCF2848679.1 EpsG family protein [Pseudoalteromonas sp. PAST1]MCO7209688.1 EpsG family protein [Pseudoalteromonas sp. ACER1]